MQKLASVFNALDPLRRTIAVLAALGAFVAVIAIARGAGGPPMSLLYSGLEPAAAGEVIGSLEQMGATYEVRGNAIFVDAGRRDSLRMALAAEGKPAAGSGGYEILDNLSGFGTTAQMFDAAYWRAKEGELARTILANPRIGTARVHIANADRRPFGREAPMSASVTITASSGLSAAQARALQFLVASAVQGLQPEDVAIIDAVGGVISGDGALAEAGTGDQAALLKAAVERLLEARVGPGRAIVEVAVERVTEREEIVERRVDPDSRVAISTVTEETTSRASDSRDGAVTVAGNLPDGDAGGSGADSSSQEAGTRERVNYEISETQREILREPGAIRRLTVAVLIDGIRPTDPGGTGSWAPRPEGELDALRALVTSAVGFDEARGDVITLQSLEFPALEPAGTIASPRPLLARIGLDAMQLAQILAFAIVALILGLFVVRPILAGQPAPALPPAQPLDLPPPQQAETTGEPAALPMLDGEIEHGFLPQMAVVADPFESDALPAIADGGDPAGRLRDLADGRTAEAALVLRSWMEDREAAT